MGQLQAGASPVRRPLALSVGSRGSHFCSGMVSVYRAPGPSGTFLKDNPREEPSTGGCAGQSAGSSPYNEPLPSCHWVAVPSSVRTKSPDRLVPGECERYIARATRGSHAWAHPSLSESHKKRLPDFRS